MAPAAPGTYITTLTLTLCVLAPLPALAQESDPSNAPAEPGEPAPLTDEEKHKRMLKLNEEGFEAFKDERFQLAAERFLAAYELVPDPNLRKNESIAWYKASRCDKAIIAANAFLKAENITEPDRVEARTVLAKCKVDLANQALKAQDFELAEQILEEASRLEPDQSTRDLITIRRVELAKKKAARQEERKRQEAALAREREQESSPNLLGWTLLGSGAGVLLGGALYHTLSLMRQDDYQEVASEANDRARYDRLAGQLSLARWLVPTLYGVGALTAGAGVYFLVMPPQEQTTSKADGARSASGSRQDVQVLIGVQGRF